MARRRSLRKVRVFTNLTDWSAKNKKKFLRGCKAELYQSGSKLGMENEILLPNKSEKKRLEKNILALDKN